MGKILIVEDAIIVREWLVKIANNIDEGLEVYNTGAAGVKKIICMLINICFCSI